MRWANLFGNQADNLPPGSFSQLLAARIHSRDCCVVGESYAQSFANCSHTGRGAHDHTMARTAHNTVLQLGPVFLRNAFSSQFGLVAPTVCTRTEFLAAPVAFKLRASSDQNRRDIRTRRAHQQRRRRLVAATEQHDTIQRIGRNGFFYIHTHQIAK